MRTEPEERSLLQRIRRAIVYITYLAVVTTALSATAAWVLLRTARQTISETVALEGDWLFDESAQWGLRLAPNVSASYAEPARQLAFHIYTDPRGLRVDAPGVRVDGPVDVLVVGGSFFFGWGVEAEDSVSERLARRTGLRVANAATPAVGTASAAAAVERLGELSPRLVVYGIIDDHVRRNGCPCAAAISPLCLAQPYLTASDTGDVRWHAPVSSTLAPIGGMTRAYPELMDDGISLAGMYWALRSAAGLAYRRVALPCASDAADQGAMLHAALDRLVASAGDARTLVVYVPPLSGAAPSGAVPAAQLAARVDLRYLDLTRRVRSYLRAGDGAAPRLSLLDDLHPNPTGHELIAAAICTELVAMGAVPRDTTPATPVYCLTPER